VTHAAIIEAPSGTWAVVTSAMEEPLARRHGIPITLAEVELLRGKSAPADIILAIASIKTAMPGARIVKAANLKQEDGNG